MVVLDAVRLKLTPFLSDFISEMLDAAPPPSTSRVPQQPTATQQVVVATDNSPSGTHLLRVVAAAVLCLLDCFVVAAPN